MVFKKKQSKKLRFESLENRVVLDAAMFSIVGQSPNAWITINNYAYAGGALSGGKNLSDGWPIQAIADFTQDGVTDVLVKGQGDGDDWQLQVNDGSTLFVVPWGQKDSVDGVSASQARMPSSADMLGVSDFDGDGVPDVVLLDAVSNELWVALTKEAFVEEQLWATLPPGTVTDVASRHFVGDFDGDGSPDVLRGVDGGRWTLARSNATRDQLIVSNWGNFPDYNWQHVLSGDFTGDGTADIAAMAPDRTWWVWSGSGDGFGAAQYVGHWKMRDEWFDLGVADFNNDGRDDLIGRSAEGELYVGSATAEGQLHTWRWGTGWVQAANWSSITHVDFNEDGRVDQVGQAADGTWWYADNQGQSFRNEYITSTQSGEIHEWLVLPNFSKSAAVNVSSFQDLQKSRLPDLFSSLGEQEGDLQEGDGLTDEAENETPDEDTRHSVIRRPVLRRNNVITVTLDAENHIVLLGGEINLLGVDVQSEGGHLTPVDGASEPFDFFLSNTANQVTFGNLGRLELLQDGRMWLPVKWDPEAGEDDLRIEWGGKLSSDDSGPQAIGLAFLEDALSATLAPEPVFSPITVTVDDQNHIVLQGHEQLTGVALFSRGGNLKPVGNFPAPFEFALVDSASNVVIANLGKFEWMRNGRLVLPIQWDPAAGKIDLTVRWGGNGEEGWATLDRELFA